jgi:hypothetical protein
MNIFNQWSAWEDVGIEYIHADFKWVAIQTRTRKSDNFRQIRHVEIMRYGGQLSGVTQKTFYRLFKVNEK